MWRRSAPTPREPFLKRPPARDKRDLASNSEDRRALALPLAFQIHVYYLTPTHIHHFSYLSLSPLTYPSPLTSRYISYILPIFTSVATSRHAFFLHLTFSLSSFFSSLSSLSTLLYFFSFFSLSPYSHLLSSLLLSQPFFRARSPSSSLTSNLPFLTFIFLSLFYLLLIFSLSYLSHFSSSLFPLLFHSSFSSSYSSLLLYLSSFSLLLS